MTRTAIPIRSPDATGTTSPLVGVFYALAVICFAVSFLHQMALFDDMRVGGRDLAFFTQSLWNASQGNGLRTTIGFRGEHLFSEHFYLAHWIWVLPYKLIPSPYLLFAVQAMAISLTGLAALRLAIACRVDATVAALLSCAVLLQPTLHGAASGINFYGYHPDTLFPALFLFACWALKSDRMTWFWILALSALATLEQAALVLAPLGIYMAVTGRTAAGIALCIASGAWFIGSTGFIVPTYSDGRSAYYLKALRMFSDAEALRFAAVEVLTYAAQFTILLAGLPLLSAASLVALPIVLVYAQAISVGYTVPLGILSWHADLVLPVLVFGAVLSLVRLQKRFDLSRNVLLVFGAAWSLALAAVTYSYVYSGKGATRSEAELATLRQVRELVPETASLSASFFVAPHLSHRANLWIFPKTRDADYVVVYNDEDYKYTGKEDEELESLLRDESYEILLRDSGFTMFRRKEI